jgi:hypothetical protein
MDPYMRKYSAGDDLIQKMVKKYDQNFRPAFSGENLFLNPNITDKILLEGHTAYISYWDYLHTEVSPDLLHSCDMHIIEDNYLQWEAG